MEGKKKSCIIFFNCHGSEIEVTLKRSKKFMNDFDIEFFPVQPYVNQPLKHQTIRKIYNADVLILQYITCPELKHVTHDIIKTYTSPKCKVIIVPHYTFAGYHHPFKFPAEFNTDKSKHELLKIFENIKPTYGKDGPQSCQEWWDNEIKEFKKLDDVATCKIFPVFLNNVKKYRLFNSFRYPTSFLFNILAYIWMQHIDVKYDDLVYEYSPFAFNVRVPILPYVKNELKLEFLDYCDNFIHFRGSKFYLIPYLLAKKELDVTINLLDKEHKDIIDKYKSFI